MKILSTNIFLLLITFCCQACFFNKSHDNCAAFQAYSEKKNKIFDLFSNQSIFRRGDAIILDVYKNQHRNSLYFLQKKKGEYFYLEMKDSLEYKSIFDFLKSGDLNDEKIKDLVEIYASGLISKMDYLGIREFTCEFAQLGVDLQFYFKDESMLIYVSNLENITNTEWKSFINRAEKIDQNWYYYDYYPAPD